MAIKNKISRFYDQELPIEDDNAWAVSYGDMISVLLCFFILLLSISVINPNKFESIKRTVEGAVEEKTSIEELEERIVQFLQQEQLEDTVNLETNQLGVDISIRDALLFNSGSAALNPGSTELFIKLQEIFKDLPSAYRFEIEGHTDDVPINTPQFPSNWHLSTARGLSVLDIFLSSGFADERFEVQGFADTQPSTPNVDNTSRSLNRRVVIKVR